MRKPFVSLFLFLILIVNAWTQIMDEYSVYDPVDERKIVETKWKYTYTHHLESNTTIHQAEKDYEYYLYFKYDNTYSQFLNGVLTQGHWKLEGYDLHYSYQGVEKFEIAQVNNHMLVLEFNPPKGTGTRQYHFIQVEDKQAPFVKPPYELPLVRVEAIDPEPSKKRWFSFGSKKKKKRKKEKTPEPVIEPTYVSIELTGGGFYGGIDPVIRDYIQIKTDGRLIKEFKSRNTGLMVTKKNISREELERFAEFIVDQQFFDLDRVYDCCDPICEKRKKMKPTPIPLRLAVTYGTRKKVITISIWGKDDKNIRYVEYPRALDNIIEAVQRMAHILEEI